MVMVRKDRSDITVGEFEKKHGLPHGTMRSTSGRAIRSNCKLGTVRRMFEK